MVRFAMTRGALCRTGAEVSTCCAVALHATAASVASSNVHCATSARVFFEISRRRIRVRKYLEPPRSTRVPAPAATRSIGGTSPLQCCDQIGPRRLWAAFYLARGFRGRARISGLACRCKKGTRQQAERRPFRVGSRKSLLSRFENNAERDHLAVHVRLQAPPGRRIGLRTERAGAARFHAPERVP